jgi:TRAP-type C4-dicarboxylate transport system substrate-binding protein
MKNREKALRVLVRMCILIFALIAFGFGTTPVRAQELKLKIGGYAPRAVYDEVIFWYFDEVSKRTGLKFTFETYFGGTLAKAQDCLDAIGKGVYDVGWIPTTFTPHKTPLSMIPETTPLVVSNLEVISKAANDLIRTLPAAAAEFENSNVKYLWHNAIFDFQLICRKPVRSLDDAKGLRIRTYGYFSKAWADLGGVPVNLAIPEVYDALQKGVLDGALSQPEAMYKVMRLYEVARYYTKMEFGCIAMPVVMNNKVWNNLPEKARKAMQDVSFEMPKIVDQMVSKTHLEAIDGMRKSGIEMYELPAADKARLKTEAGVISKYVVDDLTAKAVTNATAAMDIYLSAVEKYRK